MSLLCNECQHSNPAGAKYCNECGAPLSTPEPKKPAIETPRFDPLHPHIQDFQFRHTWRPYQQRVLNAVNDHLADDKLHIVAAPGSGKTTLGIEIFWRLDRPALVLSPTRTIRDQWISRLKDFLPTHGNWPVHWTSKDLNELKLFSSVTYQALYTIFRHDSTAADVPAESDEAEDTNAEPEDQQLPAAPSQQDVEQLIGLLHQAKIGTLILDEAHHLRAAWWNALALVVERLPYIKLVSLTATPPYDVSGHEWKKYHELCGPIDEEISVPELVKTGTLCPHQDFLWTVVPLTTEAQYVEQYQRSVRAVCDQLTADAQFLANVQNHVWVNDESLEVEQLLDHPNEAISMLVYLKDQQQPLPPHLLTLLDLQPEDLPPLTRKWWQALLKFYLFHNSWTLDPDHAEHRKTLAQQLRSKHLLWRYELRLADSKLVKSALTLSRAKITACVRIHEFERELRGEQLRQVILTDYIRDTNLGSERKPPLGAWPVFSALVDKMGEDTGQDIALLTGRLVVIHSSRLPLLRRIASNRDIFDKPLENYPHFMQVSVSRGSLVALITQLFVAGDIHVLVGTRSLLGEGWDAPCINSLILASFVGSYVLTNQMRGRAIRVDKKNPDKVASIWHIVAIFKGTWDGLADFFELQQRFNTFVGLHVVENAIESGLTRLKLPYYDDYQRIILKDINEPSNNMVMIRRLRSIADSAQRWHQAIEKGEAHTVVPTIKTSKPPTRSPLLFKNTLKYLLLQIAEVFAIALFSALTVLRAAPSLQIVFIILIVAAAGATLFTLPNLIKAARLYFRHLPVDGTIRQMGLAVRDALSESGLIKTPKTHASLVVNQYQDGSVHIGLRGGSFYEQSLFVDAMEEILGPVENPRYLLTRHQQGESSTRTDFHAVPAVLGAHKERAEILKRVWEERLGATELIYLRTYEGRQLLLKARSKTFSNAYESDVFRFDRWN
jgi:superfamily II DNA or RNA helicase